MRRGGKMRRLPFPNGCCYDESEVSAVGGRGYALYEPEYAAEYPALSVGGSSDRDPLCMHPAPPHFQRPVWGTCHRVGADCPPPDRSQGYLPFSGGGSRRAARCFCSALLPLGGLCPVGGDRPLFVVRLLCPLYAGPPALLSNRSAGRENRAGRAAPPGSPALVGLGSVGGGHPHK